MRRSTESRILIVEDNDIDAENAKRLIGDIYDLHFATSLDAAFEKARAIDFDCVLLDLGLPESAGSETLERFLAGGIDLPIVVLTGIDDDALGNKLMKLGAQDYLPKSRMDSYSMGRAVSYAIERGDSIKEMRRSARRWSSILDSVPEMVVIIDRHGEIQWLNRTPSPEMDPEFLVGRSIDYIFVGSGLGAWVRKRISGVEGAGLELRVGDQNFACKVAPVGQAADEFVVTIRDVTPEKELEQELNRTQRLNAVGRLAGGVAHDFNNLLTVILNVTEMVIHQEDLSADSEDDLNHVIDSGRRAADLIEQLLTFAKKRASRPRVIDMNTAVMSMDPMIRRTLVGRGIELQVITPDRELPIFIDPSQFEQVVMNLIVNARHAIEREGTVTIEVMKVDEKAVLQISDTGIGMSPETLEKIFEPFFTTHTEDGTGLGMSTVYGIVTEADGNIRVHSKPGEGATFRIEFELQDPDSVIDAISEAEDEEIRFDGFDFIVIDDQPLLRRSVERILKQVGGIVRSYPSAEDALENINSGSNPCLIVSDVFLPGLSGIELTQRVREDSKVTPIVLMSGYYSDEEEGVPVDDPNTHFIAKPFTTSAFLSSIRKALNR